MAERVVGALGPAVVAHTIAFGELTLVVQASDIVYALTYLRDDPACAFRSFIDICGVGLSAARAALRRGLPPALPAP